MNDTTKLPVTVIITTYDSGNGERYKLLYQTVQSLVDNLVYPNLHWIITDDSAEICQEMVDTVSKIIPSMDVSFFHTFHRGVGFSKNNSLQEAFKISPITLLMEDDWLLTEKLDLLPHVQLLLDHADLSMIRFGFLGGEMTAKRLDYGNWLAYWELSAKSGFYVYSGQVSLRHKRFYDAIGWHDENCTAGQEEESMCWRYSSLDNSPKILWPCQYGSTINAGPFKNIGLGNSVNSVEPGK